MLSRQWPRNSTSIAKTLASSGAISKCETVVLLSLAEVDAAMNKAVDYRPPGS